MNHSITRAEIFTLRVPLPCTVFLGDGQIVEREFAVAVVESGDGRKGWGHTFTRGAPVAAAARKYLVPELLGEDARLTERLWCKMARAASLPDAEALVMRGISILDIALWDWKARLANLPLYQLLGGVSNRVPLLVPGGYRRENDPSYSLSSELAYYRTASVTAVKLMFTPMQLETRAAEVIEARDALGYEVLLGNDFHSTGKNAREVKRALDAVAEAKLDFIEDPFALSLRQEFTAFRQEWVKPLVTGETVSTLAEGHDLCRSGWINAARFDATVCGGVTAWLKMRALAAAHHQPVWPHCFPEIHAHLAAATGQPFVESPLPAFETVNFAAVLNSPLPIVDGHYELSDRPGLGLELDEDKLQALRTEQP